MPVSFARERIEVSDILAQPAADLRFGCKACGKCCNAPPMLHPMEVQAYAEDFILLPEFRFCAGTEAVHGDPHAWFRGRRGEIVQVQVVIATLDRHGSDSCPKNTNNKCDIYDRRPLRCRTNPLDEQYIEKYASRVPMWSEHDAAQFGFECDYSDTAPWLIKNDLIVDPVYAEAYAEARGVQELSADYVMAIPLEVLSAHYLQGQASGPLPLEILLAAGVMLEHFTADEAYAILTAQISRIDDQIAAARQRKNPNERATTRLIRDLRSTYLKIDGPEAITTCMAEMMLFLQEEGRLEIDIENQSVEFNGVDDLPVLG